MLVILALAAWAGPAKDSQVPSLCSLPVVWGKAWKARLDGVAGAAGPSPKTSISSHSLLKPQLPLKREGDGAFSHQGLTFSS